MALLFGDLFDLGGSVDLFDLGGGENLFEIGDPPAPGGGFPPEGVAISITGRLYLSLATPDEDDS